MNAVAKVVPQGAQDRGNAKALVAAGWVLGYLSQLPREWALSTAELCGAYQISKDRAQKAIRETVAAGYLECVVARDDHGRIAGVRYRMRADRPLTPGEIAAAAISTVPATADTSHLPWRRCSDHAPGVVEPGQEKPSMDVVAEAQPEQDNPALDTPSLVEPALVEPALGNPAVEETRAAQGVAGLASEVPGQVSSSLPPLCTPRAHTHAGARVALSFKACSGSGKDILDLNNMQLTSTRAKPEPWASAEGGKVTTGLRAPVEVLADYEPSIRIEDMPESPRDCAETLYRPAIESPQTEELTRSLIALGVTASVAKRLVAESAAEVARQIAWLPERKAHNPAAMVVRAIQQAWDEPTGAKYKRIAAERIADRDNVRASEAQEWARVKANATTPEAERLGRKVLAEMREALARRSA